MRDEKRKNLHAVVVEVVILKISCLIGYKSTMVQYTKMEQTLFLFTKRKMKYKRYLDKTHILL